MNPREGECTESSAMEAHRKFHCLVEWLNLVGRGLLPDAKCRAFEGSSHDKKNGLAGGSARQRTAVLDFSGTVSVQS